MTSPHMCMLIIIFCRSNTNTKFFYYYTHPYTTVPFFCYYVTTKKIALYTTTTYTEVTLRPQRKSKLALLLIRFVCLFFAHTMIGHIGQKCFASYLNSRRHW